MPGAIGVRNWVDSIGLLPIASSRARSDNRLQQTRPARASKVTRIRDCSPLAGCRAPDGSVDSRGDQWQTTFSFPIDFTSTIDASRLANSP